MDDFELREAIAIAYRSAQDCLVDEDLAGYNRYAAEFNRLQDERAGREGR